MIALYCVDLDEKNALRLLCLVLNVSVTDKIKNKLVIHSDSGIVSYKETNLSTEFDGKKAKEVPVTDINLFRAILVSLLKRSAGYSQILLSEAFRLEISPGLASLFLRVLSYQLSQFSGNSSPEYLAIGSLRDSHLKRAITWTEAIIDAHFPSFILSVSTLQRRNNMNAQNEKERVDNKVLYNS